MGFEPTTAILRVRRTTNCATPPLKVNKCVENVLFTEPFLVKLNHYPENKTYDLSPALIMIVA